MDDNRCERIELSRFTSDFDDVIAKMKYFGKTLATTNNEVPLCVLENFPKFNQRQEIPALLRLIAIRQKEVDLGITEPAQYVFRKLGIPNLS